MPADTSNQKLIVVNRCAKETAVPLLY